MDLRVDGAGKDQGFAEIVALVRGGSSALPYRCDPAIAYSDIAALDDAIGEDHGAGETEIEIGQSRLSSGFGAVDKAGATGQQLFDAGEAIVDQHRKDADNEAALQDECGVVGGEASDDHFAQGFRRHG